MEYKLCDEANKRHNALPSALQKAQSGSSGWYELLRFGRKLGSDPLPLGVEHWREIKIPGDQQRWVNLNTVGTVFKTGLRKLECARAIAPHMDIRANRSKSFQVFRSAVSCAVDWV